MRQQDHLGDHYHNFENITRGEVNLNHEDLRPEDLTSMIENVYTSSQMQSSRISSTHSNDVLKTFQEQCMLARTRQVLGDGPQQLTNQKKHPLLSSTNQNSMNAGIGFQ